MILSLTHPARQSGASARVRPPGQGKRTPRAAQEVPRSPLEVRHLQPRCPYRPPFRSPSSPLELASPAAQSPHTSCPVPDVQLREGSDRSGARQSLPGFIRATSPAAQTHAGRQTAIDGDAPILKDPPGFSDSLSDAASFQREQETGDERVSTRMVYAARKEPQSRRFRCSNACTARRGEKQEHHLNPESVQAASMVEQMTGCRRACGDRQLELPSDSRRLAVALPFPSPGPHPPGNASGPTILLLFAQSRARLILQFSPHPSASSCLGSSRRLTFEECRSMCRSRTLMVWSKRRCSTMASPQRTQMS